MKEGQKFWKELCPKSFGAGYSIGVAAVERAACVRQSGMLPLIIVDDKELYTVRRHTRVATDSLIQQYPIFFNSALFSGLYAGIDDNVVRGQLVSTE